MNDPDDLVHQLQEKPSDPELLRQLDRIAWEFFHDPWEVPPSNAPQLSSDPVRPGGPMPNTSLQPLSVELVMNTLDVMALHHTSSPTGTIIIPFGYRHDSDREAWIRISIQGEKKDLLVWRMTSDRRVDAPQFGLAFRLCNAWAAENRWPRAFVDIPTPDEDGKPMAWEPSGSIELDHHVSIQDGISMEALKRLLSTLTSSGFSFWAFARKEYGL